MKRLKTYLIFLIIAVAITLLLALPFEGRPYPSDIAAHLRVSGFPLQFFINGVGNWGKDFTDEGLRAYYPGILWGPFVVNVLFWFLVVTMVSKARDLLKAKS